MSTPQSRPEATLLSSYAGRSGASDGPQNACKPSRERQRGYERTRRTDKSMTLNARVRPVVAERVSEPGEGGERPFTGGVPGGGGDDGDLVQSGGGVGFQAPSHRVRAPHQADGGGGLRG